MFKSLVSVLLLLSSSLALAAEPDFYIIPNECKILVGSMKDGSIKITPGAPGTYGCSRQGKNMVCSVQYKEGEKSVGGSVETYRILLDGPPFLYFASENGATFFSINTERRSVVVTARMTHENFIGEKVCGGLYTTSYEVDLLRKQGKQSGQ